MDFTDNFESSLALNLVLHTHHNLFLTGRAGTGKTSFLHKLCGKLRKSYVVVAPTGIAALNANGTTLHSQFSLPIDPYVPCVNVLEKNPNLTPITQQEKRVIIKSLQLIIIDEVSMVRADTLQALNDRLCQVRKNNKPFGGVQLLLIGDLYQLPPVAQRDWRVLEQYYKSAFFFSSPAFKQSEFCFIELKKIYRQTDSKFIELLECIRTGRGDLKSALECLNTRAKKLTPIPEKGCIVLTALRKQSNENNERYLQELEGESHTYIAAISGNFPEKDSPTDIELSLKVGAQVMFIRNDSSENCEFVNGEIGTVTYLDDSEIKVQKLSGGLPISVPKIRWDKFEYHIDTLTRQVSRSVAGTFIQYPLILAWSITIHKSQGLTFDKVRIDAARIFASGQLYVAMSRCRSLEGIELTTPIPFDAIRVSTKIEAFIAYCQTHMLDPRTITIDEANTDNKILDCSANDMQQASYKTLGRDDLKKVLKEYITTKRDIRTLYEEYVVQMRDWIEVVSEMISNEEISIQSIISANTLAKIESHYKKYPDIKIGERITQLYGIAYSYEVRWYASWKAMQTGLFGI